MKISEIISAMSTAIIPIVAKGTPESMIFAAGVQPLLSTAIDSILLDIFQKGVTKKETIRLGISYMSAVNQVNENMKNNIPFRQDDMFVSSNMNYSDASDVIEATINSIMLDSEHKKSEFYGYFIANLGFSPEVDYTNALYMQNIIKQLSFKQLCIIRYFQSCAILDLSNCTKYIENSGDIKSMEIYFGIKELIRLNLLKRHPPYTLGVDMQNHSLNVNGQLICKMLSLHKIDIDSINAVDNIFKKMGVKKL